ncbi:Uncharacterised protein [Bordetella pertussis]|nr:Uncharacterised protein [Bordetella pertussis]
MPVSIWPESSALSLSATVTSRSETAMPGCFCLKPGSTLGSRE